jgi:hypothetical protein
LLERFGSLTRAASERDGGATERRDWEDGRNASPDRAGSASRAWLDFEGFDSPGCAECGFTDLDDGRPACCFPAVFAAYRLADCAGRSLNSIADCCFELARNCPDRLLLGLIELD